MVPAVVGLGVLTLGAGPASASGPPVPLNCTFDRGIETCVTSMNSTRIWGPYSTGTTPATTIFGDLTGVQICEDVNPFTSQLPVNLSFEQLTWQDVTTTTTTTLRQGLGGRLLDTSTLSSTGPAVNMEWVGVLVCHFAP